MSLLILLLPVLLLVGGYQLLSGRQQAVEVDPTPAYAQASAAGLAVTGSADPGSDWVPVSAQFDSHATGGTLRVGYVTPAGDPVQVVHSTVPPEVLLPERLPDAGPPSGEVQLDGENWQWYAGRSGEQALVRMAPDLTTIVVGDADEAELRHLATHS